MEKCIEIFIDDFSVFGSSFEECLKNLEAVLTEMNLVLNWEKSSSLYVIEVIILGHTHLKKWDI